MQLFIIIDNQTKVIHFEDNIEINYDVIMKKIEEKCNFNRIFFWLKLGGKIFNDSCQVQDQNTLELMWRNIKFKKLYTNEEQDEFITIPYEVLKESTVIKNLLDPMDEDIELSANLDEENKLVFNTEIIKKTNVYLWINLSYLIKEFLSSLNKSIDNFEIERPLTNKPFSNYIGEKADKYISSLTLDELKELACLSDFLDIKYLLETICAFIAYKFVKNKTIEEIRDLNLI